MGKTSDEVGESSTRSPHKPEDADDEQPLKKARYIWQIKGKYHLKERDRKFFVSESNSSDCLLPVDMKACEEDYFEAEQNVCECGEGKLVVSPRATLVLETCEDEGNNKKTEDNMEVNEEVDGDDEDDDDEYEDDDAIPAVTYEGSIHDYSHRHLNPNQNECLTQRFPTFLNSVNHSSCRLRKWQTKQLAKGIVDNTINKVLEDMGFVPLQTDSDDILEDQESSNHSRQNLENEAVLMAIQSHGLQRQEYEAPSGSEKSSSPADDGNKKRKVQQCLCTCSLQHQDSPKGSFDRLDPFHHRPIVFEQEDGLAPTKVYTNIHSLGRLRVKRMKAPKTKSAPSVSLGKGNDTAENDSSLLTDKEKLEDTEKPSEVNEQSNSQNDEGISVLEHDNFLDQAVSVAIEKKGLGMLCCIDQG